MLWFSICRIGTPVLFPRTKRMPLLPFLFVKTPNGNVYINRPTCALIDCQAHSADTYVLQEKLVSIGRCGPGALSLPSLLPFAGFPFRYRRLAWRSYGPELPAPCLVYQNLHVLYLFTGFRLLLLTRWCWERIKNED